MAVERPDQVWCADVTYIPMRRGFLYLVAIIDWFSRKVLGWRLSTTRDADFCVASLDEAIACHGKPNILNTDQGSQFTSFALTTTLKDTGISISGMDAALDGQHLHRAAVTQPQIRMRLPQRLREGKRSPQRHRFLDRLLQPATPALGLRRQDAHRGLCYGGNDGETGGVETNPIHLSQAAKLSHQADHFSPRHVIGRH
nr:IS3 family transposase [Rhizobium sp. Q54]